MPKPPPQVTLQLRVELEDVTPAIWRRILVPTSVRLDRLAEMLLAGMGWTNSHLHCFEIGDERYGMQCDDFLDDELDERSVTVLRALRDVESFAFHYDFGDGWVHDVTVESVVESTFGLKHAVCLDGANACPPEDCGGPHGFEYFLEALTDPTHDEHDDYVDWNGGATFDRSAFEVVSTNAALQKVASRARAFRL